MSYLWTILFQTRTLHIRTWTTKIINYITAALLNCTLLTFGEYNAKIMFTLQTGLARLNLDAIRLIKMPEDFLIPESITAGLVMT